MSMLRLKILYQMLRVRCADGVGLIWQQGFSYDSTPDFRHGIIRKAIEEWRSS